MATNKVTVNNLWQEEILVSSTTTTAVVLPMDHQWQVTSRAWVVDMKKPHSTHKVLGGVGELSINPLLRKLLGEGTVTWMAWLVITLILKVHYVTNRDLMKLRWWWQRERQKSNRFNEQNNNSACASCFVAAGLKCRSQVTGYRSQVRLQATGYRPQVTGRITGHRSGHRSHTKTIGHWAKLFWTDVLLYKII